MARNVAMLDTNSIVLLVLRAINGYENSNNRLKQFYSRLQITNELVHCSILDEVGNLLIQNLGSVMANALLSTYLSDNYFEVIHTSENENDELTEIVNNHPSNWQYNQYKRRSEHKDIGYADARFLLTAKKFVASANFDHFSIITYDNDLQLALLDPRYEIAPFVKINLPRRDQNLSPIQYPMA